MSSPPGLTAANAATAPGNSSGGNASMTSARNPLLLLLLLALANFMQVLDLTIANVSLPAITGDLGAAPSQGAWIVTSFAAACAITIPLTGWLSDRFGQVRIFCAATVLFTLASFLCGIAWSLPSLIACRVLQGAAAGFMIPLSQALMLNNYPAEKRGMALSIWTMTATVAPIVGPILGGWITDNYHWRWIFFLNVPVGIFASLALWALLKERETPLLRRPLDRVGLALLVIWVGSLQVLLDKGNELDWFNSAFIVVLAVIAAFGFALFLAWELTGGHPIVDLSLFLQRNFRTGVLVLTVSFAVLLAMHVILPLWVQTQLGYTAQWAGYVLAPGGIMGVLLAPLVGRQMRRIDPRFFASIACLVFALHCFARAQLDTGADFLSLALPQLLMGIATAMFFAPMISISLGGIEPLKVARASSLQNFVRQMSGSFGTALAVAFWDRREIMHRAQLAEHLGSGSPAAAEHAARLEAAGMSPVQVLGHFESILTREAYMLATNDFFWVCGWSLLALLPLIWLARPPFSAGTVPAAE